MSTSALTRRELLDARGPKNTVDPRRPYAFLVEPERSAAGQVEDVATIFLTNKECPFSCVYCDLWKNTTDERVQPGDIPAQIDYALSRLPPAKTIKLYNSGNFFDPQAIPPEDYPAIINRLMGYDRVIVENHPKLVTEECVRFRDQLGTELEIAIGLETVSDILPSLNKQMTKEDFWDATAFLRRHGIHVRAFVLLLPPFMQPGDAVQWAAQSVDFALQAGSGCVAIIPTRGGNGFMERLAADGKFSRPTLAMVEEGLAASFELPRREEQAARVFADLWDLEKLFECPVCGPRRTERLEQMNFLQMFLPKIHCDC